MILHLRIEDGTLVPTDELVDWAVRVTDEYFGIASVLEEGVHDVTPRSFGEGSNRHRAQVLSDGTAVYGVYRGEELQEPLLATSEPGQKTQVISPSFPTFLISLATRIPDMIFVLAIIFYSPDLLDFQPDLSRISQN